ncbi:MAG: hypothetical protein ACK5XX_06795 [Holosporales bacterium]
MFFDIKVNGEYRTQEQKDALDDVAGGFCVRSKELGKVYRLTPERLLAVTKNECMENKIKVLLGDTELNVRSAIKKALNHNSKLYNQSGAALSESPSYKEAQDVDQDHSNMLQILNYTISKEK